MKRREFLKVMGIGAAAAALPLPLVFDTDNEIRREILGAKFDGTNDYLARGEDLTTGGGQMTICTWQRYPYPISRRIIDAFTKNEENNICQ